MTAAEAEPLRAVQDTEAEAETRRIASAGAMPRGAAGRTPEDTQNEILTQLEGKQKSPSATRPPSAAATLVDLPPESAAATPGVPILNSLGAPPLSSSSKKCPPPRPQQPQTLIPKMVGHGINSRVLTQAQPPTDSQQQQAVHPPSFDFVEQQQGLLDAPPPPAPTAPQYEDYLQGIQPVMPPPSVAPLPPSFAEFETAQINQNASVVDEDGIFAYDENGNPLTMQQRQTMVDEQRRLYERIVEENATRSKDAAANKADAFDVRSTNAVARAMPGGEEVATNAAGRNRQPVDAQRTDAVRQIQIGANQTAAIHGQDRTKQAIRDGTAILVQCLSCQNWMQVTDTATLMMCPVCQVVSPVIRQDQVLTKEEAIQLTMDRKMAEKLQEEAYAEQDQEGSQDNDVGFFGSLFGSSEAASAKEGAASLANTTHASDSWWDKMSSMVSSGIVLSSSAKERSDLGVTRPPGNPDYPGAPAACNNNEETCGLLTPAVVEGDGNLANLPAARGAEQRPLFSCVVEGMSNAASAISTSFSADMEAGNEEADALIVTSMGRGVGDGVGEYSRVPDERL